MTADDLAELRQRASEAQWFVDCFSSDSGKRVLAFLANRFFVQRTTVNESRPLDPAALAYREGQRSVVLYLNDLANWDLTAARKMVLEYEESHRKAAEAPDPLAV